MAKMFEQGRKYGAWDTGTPNITILKRTAKTATVQDDDSGEVWTMRIKTRADGGEYMVDSRVPVEWRECYTYEVMFAK